MKFLRFNIWRLTILLLLFSGLSSANERDTIRFDRYDAHIYIDSSGKMHSQISISFNHQFQELLLPMLNSGSYKIKNNNLIKTSVVGSGDNKYVHITAIDSNLLPSPVLLEVVYAGVLSETNFLDFFHKPKHNLFYSNPKGQMVEANSVNIDLGIASNFSYEMTNALNNHSLQTKIHSSKKENRMVISGENVCLNSRNIGVVARNESHSYVTPLLFILILISVYYGFLKYVVIN